MSEKRFFTTLANDEYTHIQKKGNPRSTYLKYSEVVDLLNEQQTIINKLKEENEQLKKARDKSDKFIVKKGLEIEFLEWCMK